MYLFLLLPLIPCLIGFMVTPLSIVQEYLAFYDLAFGGYAVMVGLCFAMNRLERHYQAIIKEATLHVILLNLCLVFRLAFMVVAVFLLMTSTLISVLHIDIPLEQALVAFAYGVVLMITGLRFIYLMCNFDRALRDDLGWK